jgi:hypothetical protein
MVAAVDVVVEKQTRRMPPPRAGLHRIQAISGDSCAQDSSYMIAIMLEAKDDDRNKSDALDDTIIAVGGKKNSKATNT